MSNLLIAGVDEAGMGPLAGPVIAAAVIFPPGKRMYKLRDSKILTVKQREELFEKIYQKALAVSIGRAEVEEINELNIYHANRLAMKRAIEGLKIKPELILIDGRSKPDLTIEMRTIIDGDVSVPSISAASIIAKVTRDREMKELHQQFPIYNFAKHKGYATKEHRILLKKHGPCPLHRTSFVSDDEIYLPELALELCQYILMK